MTRRLQLDREGRGRFVLNEPNAPGSPYVGRGHTMLEALGNFLLNHQQELDITIDVGESAQASEIRRRRRELSKR